MGDEKAIYAFVREKVGKKVFVILNFSNTIQPVSVKDKTLFGNANNVFTNNIDVLNTNEWKMKPWGYNVFEYKYDKD